MARKVIGDGIDTGAVKLSGSTYLGKKFGVRKDADTAGEYTMRFEMDFSGVSYEQLAKQHVTRTSFLAMFRNNVIESPKAKWDSITTKEKCASIVKISVKTLLDTRKSSSADPVGTVVAGFDKALGKGVSKMELIRAMLKRGMISQNDLDEAIADDLDEAVDEVDEVDEVKE